MIQKKNVCKVNKINEIYEVISNNNLLLQFKCSLNLLKLIQQFNSRLKLNQYISKKCK